MPGLLLIDRGRLTLLYGAESATSGTHVTEDEEGGSTLREAPPDIGAVGAFTDGVEALFMEKLLHG